MSEIKVNSVVNSTGDNDSGLDLATNDIVKVKTANNERMRVDASGNILFNKTALNNTDVGARFNVGGDASFVKDGGACLKMNRTSSHGDVIEILNDNTSVGAIATDSSVFKFYGVFSGGAGLGIYSNRSVRPLDSSGDASDNDCDLGHSSQRYATLFAGTPSINTSDENEKQDVEVFSDAEMKVAKKISSLFKKFKYKDAVIAKGDDARVHSGVIAQEIEKVFKEEKLDASNYAFWCKDTWKNDDGKEQTRYGIRYSELLSFICAYNDQRFASIEARLTALEGK
tara:strand:+ start:565 stop:1416 length:852 start_codon:yes stop_codon:yes gene_type:complete